jgi:hypothetical protein
MVTFNKDIKIIQWGKESNFSKSLFFSMWKKVQLEICLSQYSKIEGWGYGSICRALAWQV